MNDTGRIVATTIIWVGLMALLGGLLTTSVGAIANANSATVLGIVIVLSVMAVIITAVVWHDGASSHRADNRALSGKRKRLQGDRVARLLDELSDEEVYELEALLLHEARAERESAARRGSE
ncbi:MAG: hypothetical protein KJ047_12325 [Anaerolineae bacterium]|nr:hypothetical protein [Anaerolineae bacterium]MEB2287172.1 hypothetical protein [Anaerolineae bacterium]